MMHVKSRAAKVEDRLVTHLFTSTRGFADVDDTSTAVCVLPGTEIAFEHPIETRKVEGGQPLYGEIVNLGVNVGIFRQINKDNAMTHHDVLELPNGDRVMLHHLVEGQVARVLTLPAAPKTEAETLEQTRLEVVG